MVVVMIGVTLVVACYIHCSVYVLIATADIIVMFNCYCEQQRPRTCTGSPVGHLTTPRSESGTLLCMTGLFLQGIQGLHRIVVAFFTKVSVSAPSREALLSRRYKLSIMRHRNSLESR